MSHNARVSLREANRRILALDIELGRTKKRLAAAEAAARWWRMAARGYILAEGEVHPDERWPWLVDEVADEAALASGTARENLSD